MPLSNEELGKIAFSTRFAKYAGVRFQEIDLDQREQWIDIAIAVKNAVIQDITQEPDYCRDE